MAVYTVLGHVVDELFDVFRGMVFFPVDEIEEELSFVCVVFEMGLEEE